MQTKSFLTQSFLLAWLAACLAYFVIVSRVDYLRFFTLPSWPLFLESLSRIAPARYLLDLFAALGGISLFSMASLSLGLTLLKSRIPNAPKLAITATAFVLGEIVFSLIFLLLINLRWLTPITAGVALLTGFLGGFPALRAWLRGLPRPALPIDFRRRERFLLGLLGGILILGLLFSSARLGYDAVVEYFSHAKIMAVSQRPIVLYPSDPFLVSSFHSTILFTSIIQLFGDQSARMLAWMNGLAILLLGLALGRELGLTPRARLWFLTLALTSTAFVDLLGDGKVELISTAPILAALYWMLRSLETPSRDNFLLVGILSGFAIISRSYNIFLVPVFVVLFYLNQMRVELQTEGFRFWKFARPILWMLPPLLILGAFHLYENWSFLRSPIAPLTYGLDLKSDWQWQFDPAILNTLRALYPLTVTFMNSPQSLGNISPLAVACLPFLFVKRIRDGFHPSAQMKRLAAVALATLVLWVALFFTVVEIRYIFFLWIILFLFMAQVLESIVENAERVVRPFTPLLVILLLTYIGGRAFVISLGTYSPVDKSGQAHCYDLSVCVFFDAVNREAPAGARVFALNAYRYYLRPDLFACSSRAEEYASLPQLAKEDPSGFWAEVYRRGFGYLIYEENFAVRHSRFGSVPDAASAPGWLNVRVVASTPGEKGVVYRLEAESPPDLPETVCVQNDKGTWEVRPSR